MGAAASSALGGILPSTNQVPRVPVRIDFDRPENQTFNAEDLLKPGLSVEPKVRVRLLLRKGAPARRLTVEDPAQNRQRGGIGCRSPLPGGRVRASLMAGCQRSGHSVVSRVPLPLVSPSKLMATLIGTFGS
jgi:hypothetical protein